MYKKKQSCLNNRNKCIFKTWPRSSKQMLRVILLTATMKMKCCYSNQFVKDRSEIQCAKLKLISVSVSVSVNVWSMSKRLELIPVSIAWNMARSIATPPLDGILVNGRVTPSSMLPVPIYTAGWRETKSSKVSCPRKQCDGRGLNPGP